MLTLPSGQLQNAPVGTKVTVRQAAQLVIQISDNTAADLLIGAVGQSALAAAVQAMGNSRPLLLKPLLTTRQMFALQYDAPTLRSRWTATLPGLVDPATGTVTEPTTSTVDSRTALLGRLPTGPPTITPGSPRPGWLDGVEWYATPGDICQAQATLHRWSQTPAGQPIAAILSANPGVDVGPGWTYVGYKGGSDTGVLTGSWYLQQLHGPTTVLVTEFSSAAATKVPDDAWFATAASGAITQLPK